jgi:hypothetical protein
MSYYLDRFEYRCADGHSNQFDKAYFGNEPDGGSPETASAKFPGELPCSGCNYKLVPASLVRVLHCNVSERDFCSFQENKYVESAAYHEAGHVVIAAVQKIPLKSRGIRIDQKGSGFSHYKAMRADGSRNLGSDAKREETIRSVQAGYIAQERFYLRFDDRLPPSGVHSDVNDINGLVEEMYSDRTACEGVKLRLWNEAKQFVENHWMVIEALAQALLKKEWSSQAPPSGERRWSTQLYEKRMPGPEVVAFIEQFQIPASIE